MKLITVLLILITCFSIRAQQIILLEQDSISQVYENIDISLGYEDFPLDLFFKNNTNETIVLNWRRELADNCPTYWDILSADTEATYFSHTDESQIPISMSPADSNFLISQIFLPRSMPGCCDIKVIFSLEDAPNQPVDTAYYHIEINSTNCLSTSVEQQNQEKVRIYPNPSSGYINVEIENAIDAIHILDMSGRTIVNSFAVEPKGIDISSIDSGVYACKIELASGHTILKRIIKH